MLRFLTTMLKMFLNSLSHGSDIQSATNTYNLPCDIGAKV